MQELDEIVGALPKKAKGRQVQKRSFHCLLLAVSPSEA